MDTTRCKYEKIKNFTKGLLLENAEKFKVMPGAKTMHHNYLGGLLVHSVECFEFAKMLYPKLKNIDEKYNYNFKMFTCKVEYTYFLKIKSKPHLSIKIIMKLVLN